MRCHYNIKCSSLFHSSIIICQNHPTALDAFVSYWQDFRNSMMVDIHAYAFRSFHTELNWTTPPQQINLGSWLASFTKALLPLVLSSHPSLNVQGQLVWPSWMSISLSSFKHCAIFWHTSLSLPNYSMKSFAVLSVQGHYHCKSAYPMNSIWWTDSCTLCCLFHLLQVLSPAEKWNAWLKQKLQVRESYLLNMPARKGNLTVWCLFYVG